VGYSGSEFDPYSGSEFDPVSDSPGGYRGCPFWGSVIALFALNTWVYQVWSSTPTCHRRSARWRRVGRRPGAPSGGLRQTRLHNDAVIW